MFDVQIPVNAPDTARGELEITYVDEELRLVGCECKFFFHLYVFLSVNKRPKRDVLFLQVVKG